VGICKTRPVRAGRKAIRAAFLGSKQAIFGAFFSLSAGAAISHKIGRYAATVLVLM